MVKHVGGFGCEFVAVAFDGFDDRLDRLFTEFLGAFFGAFGKELRSPAAGGIGILARGNQGCEIIQRQGRTAMPAAAICALACAMVKVPK